MARKERYNSPTLYRCYDCGWYIGSLLLKPDRYDGRCPVCDAEVDTKHKPSAADLREMNKHIQQKRKK